MGYWTDEPPYQYIPDESELPDMDAMVIDWTSEELREYRRTRIKRSERSPQLRQYNPTIQVPDGRRFRGLRPRDVAGRSGEGPYIAALAEVVGGIAEVVLPAGRADVATNADVWEVEPVASWRHGAQQAFAYAGMTGLKPALALFGLADYLPIFTKVRDRMPGLTLWRWRGEWVRVTSRTEAARECASSLPPGA
jgi:hypothetical protein